MGLRKIGWSGMDWIHVDRDKGQYWTLVNTVMILQVQKMLGNF
jgi:hypothetical protein